jgi:hypothetical protein
LINVIISENVKSCKNIVAIGNATEGDFNLLLKVRDPSRPGPQILCIVPEGYEYSYTHPWTGKVIEFISKHKFIGVTTNKDSPPNIVKAGMVITDAGLAFGDADTNSKWRNPTKNAWDDFDWMRYTYEQADSEDQAVKLLTKDCVDKLHAIGVTENLFVVGPKKGFVIEADAFRYKIKEINDFIVMSNYPKELWRTQWHKKLPIASSFDIQKEKDVRKFQTIRLDSLYGIKIIDMGEDWIVARQLFPILKFYNNKINFMGNSITIHLGERKTVGDYSVKLVDITSKKATVSVCYVYKAWEDAMSQYIQSKYGHISISDMINWSRLHEDDLDNLRPMCEDIYPYESAMIFKIPQENYNLLSSGWFSANHACASIYVPIHISNLDIYEAYKTGKAAELSIDLLNIYQHDTLTSYFFRVEKVFLNETYEHEKIAKNLIDKDIDIRELLTVFDINIQKQAWLTEKIWLEVGEKYNRNPEIIDIIAGIWERNYSVSLDVMESAIDKLKNKTDENLIEKISDIALNICKSRINAVQVLDKNITNIYEEYKSGKKSIEQDEYAGGFQALKNAFHTSTQILNGKTVKFNINREDSNQQVILSYFKFYIIILFLSILFLIFLIKKKKSK